MPVTGGGARGDAAALLATLANCDVEDGEAEIAGWLAGGLPAQAADELIAAASHGSPGLRGAGFAVLDRIGEDAVAAVRAALADPVLRAHAAVWLHEHGENAELGREDRAWLLVDLGAGLLEEADPQDVVAELLPDVPPDAQAELVAGLWRVQPPGRDRPADRAQRSSPGSRRGPGRPQGGVQGPVRRGRPQASRGFIDLVGWQAMWQHA